MPQVETTHTVTMRCGGCGATTDYVYALINGREPDSAELFDQLRQQGVMATPELWGPKSRRYCGQCGPSARLRALGQIRTPPDIPETPSDPVQAKQGGLGLSGIPAKPRSLS